MTTHPTPTVEQIAHIDAVIAAIELEEVVHLDMETFIRSETIHMCCGTSACIAGFSAIVSTSIEDAIVDGVNTNNEGLKFGLDYDEARDLFIDTQNAFETLADITKTMAIAALEDVRITGRFLGWADYAYLNPDLQD
jgi:hypothetical protein